MLEAGPGRRVKFVDLFLSPDPGNSHTRAGRGNETEPRARAPVKVTLPPCVKTESVRPVPRRRAPPPAPQPPPANGEVSTPGGTGEGLGRLDSMRAVAKNGFGRLFGGKAEESGGNVRRLHY